jgi:hypothetical protein
MTQASSSRRSPEEISTALRALAEHWARIPPRERGNFQPYMTGLCEALGVERPGGAASGYEYELPVKIIDRDGKEATNFIDLFKRDHFLLEAKDKQPGRSDDLLLRKAYGQARSYITHLPGATPPYLMVLDVARTLVVWDRWEGGFGGFGAGKRIDLATLHERPQDIALLLDIWREPEARNPRARAQAITEAIAAKLARLAASLEARHFGQERVSRFLMRCVFTMFAEDVRLLPDEPFRRLVGEVALPNPEEFVPAAEELWKAMDAGKRFGLRKLLRFNGHFFKDAEALPLDKDDLGILLQAAEADWSDVEPSIFGTLLTRALDPEERHRLGAEYTPPEFIARVVRPTVEEPLRERWTAVQAEVLQIREGGKAKDRKLAEQKLREFHDYLRALHFLDPACGSGNFLYVTMHMVKRIEVEVLNELASVTGTRELRFQEVDPSQFYGIEIKPWAREIAELTLWIGFHQFWRRTHGDIQPEEPILRDTGTLENRDAILTSEGTKRDPSRDRPDPRPCLRHPATGELVPDPAAKLEYMAVIKPQEARWPAAEFIIGNPPFLGEKRQRDLLGDGYVDALRGAYPALSDNADLVMYWWHKAAKEVASGRTFRAGLITTQSITQSQNRTIIAAAAEAGARVCWAIADHPWCDGAADTAEVRVSMTVIAKDPASATLATIPYSRYARGDLPIIGETRVPRLNFDLSAHADVPEAATMPLVANRNMCSQGYKLVGDGFVCEAEEARALIAADERNARFVLRFRNGKDLTTRPRDVYVIDFGLCDEDTARSAPMLYDRLHDRVMPSRQANPRATYAKYWWRFAEARRELREALRGLPRYLATSEVAKFRVFTFLDADVAPDGSLMCVASDDDFIFGVLSSSIHGAWSLAAGSRMGIVGTPRYSKGACFEAFPFPDPTPELRRRVSECVRRIDAHRKAAIARSDKVGMTSMYNVVDRLRAGTALTKAEREVHQLAACGTLRDLHDDLDRAVAEAYGWPWPATAPQILDRLVALHETRVEEERRGTVRWLRPDYQIPRFGKQTETGLAGGEAVEKGEDTKQTELLPWPADAIGQITALRALASAGAITVEEACARFRGGRKDIVARHLETLAILGELHEIGEGHYTAASPVG